VDFRPTEEQQLLRRSVREFAETEMRPHVREWDEHQHFPAELMPKLASLGLLGIQFPEQYGGAGLSAIDYCICIEELARVDPAVALSVAAHNGLCSAHIFLFGNEQQKQKYLPPLTRGQKIGAWGLTESSSGSDAAGMRTTATRAGDCWVLNGSKTFTTHGRVGDTMVVMAVTDRVAGTKGISAFVVEKGTPGLSPERKRTSWACGRATPARCCSTTAGYRPIRCWARRGKGSSTRCRCSMRAVSGLRRCRWAWRRAPTRRRSRMRRCANAFGKTISTFQAIQWKLADAATRIEARGC
jgi:alkylation response protein AidB-like acyl-CoA dehydrogenase